MWEVADLKEAMYKALELRQGSELTGKFARSSVAVCGLGGLGSHVALALARAGIGRLDLFDFDVVDLSNLNRQQYKVSQVGLCKTEALRENILEVAPYCDIRIHTGRLTEENIPELLADADVVCEAFDRPEEKAMLVDAVTEHFPKKYLVCASGMAGLFSANMIRTRRISRRLYLCGDEVSELVPGSGLMAPRVMLCAAHQAHMILRILAGELEP